MNDVCQRRLLSVVLLWLLSRARRCAHCNICWCLFKACLHQLVPYDGVPDHVRVIQLPFLSICLLQSSTFGLLLLLTVHFAVSKLCCYE